MVRSNLDHSTITSAPNERQMRTVNRLNRLQSNSLNAALSQCVEGLPQAARLHAVELVETHEWAII